ncbi:MAG TPA: formyltransferase family protein [Caulobacteraceae bacterium]|nr:formyltransferase family protein [Caulobacteraceae bacterium]
MISSPVRLGFLASKNGAGMRAIVTAIEVGDLAAQPRLVVSNRHNAPALEFAVEHAIPTCVIPTISDPAGADAALAEALTSAGVDLVVLSGYLRQLGPKTLTAYENRVLNVHPSLLPKYGGAGMYGRKVHEAVAAAGERVSGASVHIVDAEYDQGPVIASRQAALAPGDDAAAIEAKVTALEGPLLVETLRRIAEGSLTLPDNFR